MLATVLSGGLIGVEGFLVEVQVDISSGLPAIDLAGLPDSAVKESRERVRSAIKNSGFSFPAKRILINLAPADTRKMGPSYDLPIALGILCCTEEVVVPAAALKDTLFLGELSLDGSVRRVNGVLPIVHSAYRQGIRRFFVPEENQEEAALVEGAEVYGVGTVCQLLDHLEGRQILSPCQSHWQEQTEQTVTGGPDFADVKGQEGVKRAMLIAAAGRHNLLMTGPPGSGKTMMARCLPTILPDLTFPECVELTKIYSVSGLLSKNNTLVRQRPFRSPHHTVSAVALTGGGHMLKPGEISLAHKGALFLDELPEFSRQALEILRQPLEERRVTISRASGTVTYPADFMLVAAMNPCPCGYLGEERCHCTQSEIARYRGKISGPLLDRIDMQVEAAAIRYEDFKAKPTASSDEMKAEVIRVQKIQQQRYQKEDIQFNSELTAPLIERYCPLGPKEEALLHQAFEKLHLSARGYHKILKVARTVADLAGEERIQAHHLAEVIQYRSLDRTF